MDLIAAVSNVTGNLLSALKLSEGSGDYSQWFLYGVVLLLSCVALGVYCACMSVWQYVNCCLCPVRTIWWLVSTAAALIIVRPLLFLIRLIVPI